MSVKFEIRITLSDKGEVRIEGPIHDKVLCYGLLDIGKDIVRNFKADSVLVPKLLMPDPNMQFKG